MKSRSANYARPAWHLRLNRSMCIASWDCWMHSAQSTRWTKILSSWYRCSMHSHIFWSAGKSWYPTQEARINLQSNSKNWKYRTQSSCSNLTSRRLCTKRPCIFWRLTSKPSIDCGQGCASHPRHEKWGRGHKIDWIKLWVSLETNTSLRFSCAGAFVDLHCVDLCDWVVYMYVFALCVFVCLHCVHCVHLVLALGAKSGFGRGNLLAKWSWIVSGRSSAARPPEWSFC